MEKHELDSKVTDAAKSILSYCTARTSTQTDAEDLAQDIILELYKSIGNLKNDAAFYGFMWSVAGNVYKKWCKKKAGTAECELTDNVIEKMNFPKDKFGNDCFVWGEEKSESGLLHGKSDYFFGIADTKNSRGDKVQFMDFPINGDMVHYIFSKSVGNVFLDIARGNGDKLSENDKAVAAELIKKGYVIKDENGMRVNAPVLTAEQAEKVRSILGGVIDEIGIEAEKLSSVVAGILKNPIPTHLKKTAKDLAYLRLFEDAVAAPVARLVEDRFLLPGSGNSILPTTYVVLK